MKTIQIAIIIVICPVASGIQQGPIVIENAHVRYTISANGENLGFLDRVSGTDYLKRDRPSACAMVRCGGTEYPATSAALENGFLNIEFGETNVKAVLKMELFESYIRIEVEDVSGDNIESLMFLNVPLTLKGRPDESFGSCAMSLNLITRVNQ